MSEKYTVTLTASEWTAVLYLLLDAHSYNAELGIRYQAGEATEMIKIIRSQLGIVTREAV